MGNNDDTKKIDREVKSILNAEALKTLGVVYGIASPFIIWLVISIFGLQSDVKLLTAKQEMIIEIQKDIKDIKDSLVDLRIKVGKIEQKVEIK